MKKYLYFLLLMAPCTAMAQHTGSLFKPSRVQYFYPPTNGTGWVLSQEQQLTYDQNGNVLVRIEKNGVGTPMRKDSNVYSSTSKLLETHKFRWEAGAYLLEDKTVDTYDTEDRPMGHFTFRWNGVWELVSGTESVRSYNPVTKEETAITKLYDSSSDKWENFTKTVEEFDAFGQRKKATYYSSDAQHNFYLFARESYSGWHNYEKLISKSTFTEYFINGAWEAYSLDTTQKDNQEYVKIVHQLSGGNSGVFRILFDEEGTHREVFKQFGANWLSISTSHNFGKIHRWVENTFDEDIRIETQSTEHEMDEQDRLIRNTQVSISAQLDTTDFMEALIDILYDNRNLPLEETMRFAVSKNREEYKPVQKNVYSDYVDVRVVTDLEKEVGLKDEVRIYPNPGIGIFTVSKNELISQVSVFNIDGQLLRKVSLEGNKLDISDLPAGVYQLFLDSEKGVFRQKVVVVAK